MAQGVEAPRVQESLEREKQTSQNAAQYTGQEAQIDNRAIMNLNGNQGEINQFQRFQN